MNQPLSIKASSELAPEAGQVVAALGEYRRDLHRAFDLLIAYGDEAEIDRTVSDFRARDHEISLMQYTVGSGR